MYIKQHLPCPKAGDLSASGASSKNSYPWTTYHSPDIWTSYPCGWPDACLSRRRGKTLSGRASNNATGYPKDCCSSDSACAPSTALSEWNPWGSAGNCTVFDPCESLNACKGSLFVRSSSGRPRTGTAAPRCGCVRGGPVPIGSGTIFRIFRNWNLRYRDYYILYYIWRYRLYRKNGRKRNKQRLVMNDQKLLLFTSLLHMNGSVSPQLYPPGEGLGAVGALENLQFPFLVDVSYRAWWENRRNVSLLFGHQFHYDDRTVFRGHLNLGRLAVALVDLQLQLPTQVQTCGKKLRMI